MSIRVPKIKNFKLITACIICLILLIKAIPTRLSDDSSEKSQHHFFHMPITKQLAESLSKCHPYHRDYKYPLSQVMWVPYYKGTFSLSINPAQNDYCQISAQSPHYKFEYNIPVKLAEYIGNLMQNYCFSSQKDLAELKQFASCMNERTYYSTGAQYMADVLRDIENYIAKWDTDNIRKINDFRKQKLAEEELSCREALSTMQKNSTSENIAEKKSYYENKALFSKCEFTLNSDGEVLSYHFTPTPDDQISNNYRIIQCW